MIVYIVVVEDRHTNPEATAWSTADKAIAYAKSQAAEGARRPEDVEVEEYEGWLWYARYSSEGDCVWVVDRVIDDPSLGDELADSQESTKINEEASK